MNKCLFSFRFQVGAGSRFFSPPEPDPYPWKKKCRILIPAYMHWTLSWYCLFIGLERNLIIILAKFRRIKPVKQSNFKGIVYMLRPISLKNWAQYNGHSVQLTETIYFCMIRINTLFSLFKINVQIQEKYRIICFLGE